MAEEIKIVASTFFRSFEVEGGYYIGSENWHIKIKNSPGWLLEESSLSASVQEASKFFLISI
jgi:hypothetical protein